MFVESESVSIIMFNQKVAVPYPPKGSLNYLKRVTLKNLVYNITWPVLSIDIHSMIAGFSWTSDLDDLDDNTC